MNSNGQRIGGESKEEGEGIGRKRGQWKRRKVKRRDWKGGEWDRR